MDGVAVTRVTGDVDIGTCDLVRTELVNQLTERPDGLIADLSEVTHFDSIGIAMLVAVSSQAEQEELTFAIAAARCPVLRPLHVAGAVGFLTLFPTLPEALASVRPAPA
nr:STAS domain-containing protein [Saccharothrix deserti]